MQLRKLLLPGLLSVTLLSGCSLFSGEEDVVKMSPLPTVENQFTPSTAWSTSVGSGIGEFYSNLHPAYADNVVYAADRKGTVKAVNADDGKEVWSVNLAEKDGWFSRAPALLSGGVTVSGGHVYIGSEKAQVYALLTVRRHGRRKSPVKRYLARLSAMAWCLFIPATVSCRR